MTMDTKYDYPPDVSMVRRIVAGHFTALSDILNSVDYRDQIRCGATIEIAEGVDFLLGMMATNRRLFPDDWTVERISLPAKPVYGFLSPDTDDPDQ